MFTGSTPDCAANHKATIIVAFFVQKPYICTMKSNLIIALAINDLLDRKVIASNSYIEEKASTPEGIYLQCYLSKEDKEVGNAFLSMQVNNEGRAVAVQLFYNYQYFKPCKKA